MNSKIIIAVFVVLGVAATHGAPNGDEADVAAALRAFVAGSESYAAKAAETLTKTLHLTPSEVQVFFHVIQRESASGVDVVQQYKMGADTFNGLTVEFLQNTLHLNHDEKQIIEDALNRGQADASGQIADFFKSLQLKSEVVNNISAGMLAKTLNLNAKEQKVIQSALNRVKPDEAKQAEQFFKAIQKVAKQSIVGKH